jgi:hypothetical protein
MKKINSKSILSLFLVVLFALSLSNLNAQSINTNRYQYLSPVPGSEMVMPSTSIIIRYGETFSSLTSRNLSDIVVTGEKSGFHPGKLILLENNNLLSFSPAAPFDYGEKVTVELKDNFKLLNGSSAPYLKYTFRIAEKKINENKDALASLKSELNRTKLNKTIPYKHQNLYQDSLPSDFPEYTVNYNNPAEGYVFFAPFVWPFNYSTYLIISDNYGVPVFYRKMPIIVFDFQKQPNGNLTYFDTDAGLYREMNNKYEIIDSYSMKNGYATDIHELRILDNGHSLMFAYDPQPVRMDSIVMGGDSDAVVIGLVLQELDENKNVVFQWRSWDHFKITDAAYDINLRDSVIDYVHGNAIEVDYDGNILLSSRHMDEITKINRTTGAIIWRWGGVHCKNNQFTFINDSIGFSHQHHIRRLPNGNYTLFDNGNLHSPPFSRAVEYQMDEPNKLVTLIWEYRNAPVTYTDAMGSTERLGNHNTVIGWGSNNAPPNISEVGPDGTQKLSFTFSGATYCYRAFKYDWDTDLFTSDKDILEFGVVPVGESGIVGFHLTNNNSETVEINSIYNRDSAFAFQQQLPIVIPPQNTVNLSVKFTPETEGIFKDDLHIRWESEGQRIAKVIHMSGFTDSVYVHVDDSRQELEFSLSQNYPNPFNPVSKIKYSLPHSSIVKLKVFDILGNEISTLVNTEQPAGNYEVEFNGSELASGIYFYRLSTGEFTSVRKMLLLK